MVLKNNRRDVLRINRALKRHDLRLCPCCQQACAEEEFTEDAWVRGGRCKRCTNLLARVARAVAKPQRRVRVARASARRRRLAAALARHGWVS